VRALGVIGHLSHDVVAGSEPQIGGGPWHAGRALRALGQDAVVFAKCGDPKLQRQLASLGLPLAPSIRGETTGFSFSYDEQGTRTMAVDSIGEPWRMDDVPQLLLRRVEWLHVAGLLRDDFDGEMLEWLARGRRLVVDAQGLVRLRQTGPLVIDGGFDRDVLRHVTVLKLAEEEARTIVGDAELESLRELGVPEVLVTFGRDGSLVITRDAAVHVPAREIPTDPTGAGDAYAVSYAAARAGGHAPTSAARRATAVVATMMTQR
jgi:sugar/nucleoside kinase (ribokinase family)